MTTNPNLAEQVWQAMRGTTEHWGGCADRAAVERVLEVFAGWLPPVDSDVIERAAEAAYASFHTQASAFDPAAFDPMPWGADSTVTQFWVNVVRAAAAEGLRVGGTE